MIKTIPQKINARRQNGCLRRPQKQLLGQDLSAKGRPSLHSVCQRCFCSFQQPQQRGEQLFTGFNLPLRRDHGNPLFYSCLANPMDSGTWLTIVHRVAELDMTKATEGLSTHAKRNLCKEKPLKKKLCLGKISRISAKGSSGESRPVMKREDLTPFPSFRNNSSSFL